MNQKALASTRLRLVFLGAIFASLIATLILRLYFLQVLSYKDLASQARANQVKLVATEPPRGRILDRNGQVLVSNGVSLVISVRKQELTQAQQQMVASRIASLVGQPLKAINARMNDRTLSPFTPVPVAENVSEDSVVYIRERQDEFPGVETRAVPIRTYPNGKLASHLLGYLGEINPEQLQENRYQGYRPGSTVGRSGLEYAYERDLRGREGLLKLEVDSAGRVRRQLGRRDPKPGYDLVTSLDQRVQKITEDSLAQGIQAARSIFDRQSGKRYVAPAGGAVVMDALSGQIIAMASFPDYDPASFVGGISQAEFQALSSDPANPLLNRTIQAAYPPGSTFKTVTMAAALETGVAKINGRFDCPGSLRIADRTFRNWKTTSSGILTLTQAMAQSCDTVFYPWGLDFYRKFRASKAEILQEYARAFGFGSRTGIEIPFEQAGRVPDEGWLKSVNKRFPQAFPYATWLPGYTVNMAIGQGDLLTTPLQLANSYVAIANGGTLPQPRVGVKLIQGNRVIKTIPPGSPRAVKLSPANLSAIRAGLEAVTTSGTAAGPFAGFPAGVGVAGKTGTSQILNKQPYAWFAGFAPARNPQYVVAVMLEEAGGGGQTAAPTARMILDGIFNLPPAQVGPSGSFVD